MICDTNVEQIFDVMDRQKLGVDEASEAIIISKACRKIQREHKLSPAQAIDYLTSSLTTMKLLGKVESQSEQQFAAMKRLSQISNVPTSTLLFKPFRPNLDQSIVTKSSSAVTPSKSNTNKETAQSNNTKKRMNISKKSHRRRLKEEEGNVKNPLQETAGSSTDVDAEVVQKVILQKSTATGSTNQSSTDSSASQTITTNRMKSPSPKGSREKRNLDCIAQGETQSAPKRQRFDSI